MSQVILHHYPNSPFAEKARTMMGFKNMSWMSVIVPTIMPKPDVVALTGGYRRTPFLQIGADIYCDTALIAEVLEGLAPQPSFYPAESAGISRILAQWADATLFWTAIPFTMQPAGLAHMFGSLPPEAVKAFAADRAVLKPGPRIRLGESTAGIRAYLAQIEAMLADGRTMLLGNSTCIADLSVYHCLWYISRGGPVAATLDPYPLIKAWMGRMKAIGHGKFEKLDSAAAVQLAHDSTPAPKEGFDFLDLHGIALGTRVTVASTDYGIDPVEGTLVLSTPTQVAIRRTDERAGEVDVHFPRIGYQLLKAE